MPFIRETIVTTINEDGSVKISPLGVHIVGKELHIKPFKPSITLDNTFFDNRVDPLRA